MNVILAGGSGLIGRRLARLFSREGGKVWVLTRQPIGRTAPPGVELVAWDGCTPAGWGRLVEQADALINLAGENIGARLWTKERKRRILSSRINPGKAVLEAMRRAKKKPEVFVQASAIGYYGPRGDEMIVETSSPGSDYVADVCKAWEASTQEVETLGIRRVIIRTGLVIDPEGTFMSRLSLPIRWFFGGPLGDGRQWFSWIHPEDEVNAISYLIRSGTARGVFNLTAPHPVTNQDFGRILADILHRPFWFPAPAPILKTVLGEMSEIVLTGQRVIPLRLDEVGYKFLFSEAKQALIDLYGSSK